MRGLVLSRPEIVREGAAARSRAGGRFVANPYPALSPEAWAWTAGWQGAAYGPAPSTREEVAA